MYLSEAPTVISLSLVNVSIWCSGDDRASLNRLLKCTPNLQHFSMSLIDHDCEQISFDIPSMDCEQKVDEILNSFRTHFWLNEHR
jgi:hypothetical protein